VDRGRAGYISNLSVGRFLNLLQACSACGTAKYRDLGALASLLSTAEPPLPPLGCWPSIASPLMPAAPPCIVMV
jgi:hypothetical protein